MTSCFWSLLTSFLLGIVLKPDPEQQTEKTGHTDGESSLEMKKNHEALSSKSHRGSQGLKRDKEQIISYQKEVLLSSTMIASLQLHVLEESREQMDDRCVRCVCHVFSFTPSLVGLCSHCRSFIQHRYIILLSL